MNKSSQKSATYKNRIIHGILDRSGQWQTLFTLTELGRAEPTKDNRHRAWKEKMNEKSV